MIPNQLKGLALFLIFVGIVLTLVGVVSVLASGNRRFMLAAVAGFILQFVGWFRAGGRAGGAA